MFEELNEIGFLYKICYYKINNTKLSSILLQNKQHKIIKHTVGNGRET